MLSGQEVASVLFYRSAGSWVRLPELQRLATQRAREFVRSPHRIRVVLERIVRYSSRHCLLTKKKRKKCVWKRGKEAPSIHIFSDRVTPIKSAFRFVHVTKSENLAGHAAAPPALCSWCAWYCSSISRCCSSISLISPQDELGQDNAMSNARRSELIRINVDQAPSQVVG